MNKNENNNKKNEMWMESRMRERMILFKDYINTKKREFSSLISLPLSITAISPGVWNLVIRPVF